MFRFMYPSKTILQTGMTRWRASWWGKGLSLVHHRTRVYSSGDPGVFGSLKRAALVRRHRKVQNNLIKGVHRFSEALARH